MARYYRRESDPIALGLSSVQSAFDKRNDREAKRQEMEYERGLKERMLSLQQKEFDAKYAPVDSEVISIGLDDQDKDALGGYVRGRTEKLLNAQPEDTTFNVDAIDKQASMVPPRESDALIKAFETRRAAARADKRQKAGDLAGLTGLPFPDGGNPDLMVEPGEYANLRKLGIEKKAAEKEPASPEMAAFAQKYAAGRAALDDAPPIKSAADQELYKSIVVDLAKQTRAQEFTDKNSLRGLIFGAGEKEKDRAFQGGQKSIDRRDTKEYRGETLRLAQERLDNDKNKPGNVQDYATAAQIFGGEKEAIAKGFDPNQKLAIQKPSITAGANKGDNNAVPQEIMEWFNSGKPSSEFPKGFTSLTPRAQGLLNSRIKQEENDINRNIRGKEFDINTAFRARSDKRDQDRLERLETVPPKERLPLEVGISKINEIENAVKVAEKLDPTLWNVGKFKLELVGASTGLYKPSKEALAYQEFSKTLNANNIIEAFERGGKTLSKTEKDSLSQYNIKDGQSIDQIKSQARGLAKVVKRINDDHYSALVKGGYYKRGVEDVPQRMEGALQSLEKATGPSDLPGKDSTPPAQDFAAAARAELERRKSLKGNPRGKK